MSPCPPLPRPAVRRALAILAGGVLAGALSCSSGGNGTGPCVTNADCGPHQTCHQGKCYLPVQSGNTSGGTSGQAGGTSGQTGGSASGQSSGEASSGAAGGSQDAGTCGTSGSGCAASSTTSSSGTGSTSGDCSTSGWGCPSGSSSSSSGASGSCSCSTSCCSEATPGSYPGVVCPNGKHCWGTTDAGVPFFCNYQSGKCDPFDPCSGKSGTWSCNGSSGGSSGSTSGAPPAVDGSGISFVVVGDTRPDPGGAYPSALIAGIYQAFGTLSPKPMAVVATGDFMESSDADLSSEIRDYESAVALLPGVPTYPTEGNHECVSTSLTTYCTGGYTTPAFDAYMQMLVDLHVPRADDSLPYYVNTLSAPNGDTARFIVTAAQSWDDAQVSWLNSQLATPSATFTFLARHEPDDAVDCSNRTPGDNTTNDCAFIADVQQAINAHPGSVTMKLEGHTHELRFDDANDALVSGGGGAPLEQTCSGNSPNTTYCSYGFFYCQERTDKTLLCTAYDSTGAPLATPPPRVITAAGVMKYAN